MSFVLESLNPYLSHHLLLCFPISPMARIESRYHYPEVGQVEDFPGVGDLPDNDEEAKEENNEFTFAKVQSYLLFYLSKVDNSLSFNSIFDI